MPAIGKGTWMTNIGRKPHPTLKDNARVEEIKNAINNGISYIDTAQRYANGYVETIIGRAIKEYNREKLFLASKVSSDHLGYEDTILALKGSLKRLNTSYLDLYLIHQYNPDMPLQETMRAMDYLIEKKLIKNIGVCDFTIEQLKKAQSFTKNKIVANQIRYSFMHREPDESGLIEYCQKNDIMVIAWRPFQQSLLSSKSTKSLEEIASKYGINISQLSALWLVSQANVVVLAKLKTTDQIEKIMEALKININKKDIDILKEKI